MRFETTFCLILSIAGPTAAAAPAVDRPATRPGSALDQLAADSQRQAHVVADPATGTPNLIVIPPGALELRGAGSHEKAQDFLTRYGTSFGLDNPGRDLVAGESRSDNLGMNHLRFTQAYQGLPVFAADLRFHFDARDDLVAVNGTVVPNLDLDPTPSVDMIEASDIARRVVAKDHGRTAIDLESTPPELMIYRTGLARGIPGTDHLVWMMEVGDGAGIREDVFVDAHRGVVVDRINGIHEIDRAIYHRTYPSSPIWQEGDTLPFSRATFSTQQNSEVNDLIDVAGETYDLYSNITSGEWLSYNGNDRQMNSVYEATTFDPPCSESLNASWNGRNTNFCGGLAVDDVIAHEWTHAYTDYTHNLIYAWQPGALNESYSDIFGEIVDQTNGHGLDTPDTKRTAGGCSTFFGTPYPHLDRLFPGIYRRRL